MNLASSLNIETDFSTKYLVECLKRNKEAHLDEYANAMNKYLDLRCVKAAALVDAANEVYKNPTKEGTLVYKVFNDLNNLKEPVDATKMYDQYISLLEASTSDTIRMDVSDANAIINDQWSWAVAAKMSNSFYTK